MNTLILYNVRKGNKAFSNLQVTIKHESEATDSNVVNNRDKSEESSPKCLDVENDTKETVDEIGSIAQTHHVSPYETEARRVSMAAKNNKDKLRLEAEMHLTRMLLVITTSFILFSIPTCVRYKILN